MKVINQFNQQKLKVELFQLYDSFRFNYHISQYLPTEILSKNNLIQPNEFLLDINQHFNNFWMTNIDQFL